MLRRKSSQCAIRPTLLSTTSSPYSSSVFASACWSHQSIPRRSLSRFNLSVMASSSQDTNLVTRLGKRKRLSADEKGSSCSAVQENGELFCDTQTEDPGKDASSEIFSVLKEPPRQQEASAPVEAEGRPPTVATLEAQGRPPTGSPKWNFNLDTPDTPLTLPPVSADWKILKRLPSGPMTLQPEILRGMATCIKRHRHEGMVV